MKIDDPEWATRGAPDNNSMIAAVLVQVRLADEHYSTHEDYIMKMYGDTREEAEEIVRNCMGE